MNVKRDSRTAVRLQRAALGVALLAAVQIGPALAAPSITINPLCAYGTSDCNATGRVSGVNVSRYVVAPYIKVDGRWWTKPTFASPTCPIRANGAYLCDITTGGRDAFATAVKVFLIPINSPPPPCGGCATLPRIPNSVANAVRTRPAPRLIREGPDN